MTIHPTHSYPPDSHRCLHCGEWALSELARHPGPERHTQAAREPAVEHVESTETDRLTEMGF